MRRRRAERERLQEFKRADEDALTHDDSRRRALVRGRCSSCVVFVCKVQKEMGAVVARRDEETSLVAFYFRRAKNLTHIFLRTTT